jgi:hypothetical protein
MKISFMLLCFLILTISSKSQTFEQIGLSSNASQKGGNIYDLSDPKAVNIKVAVWGAVKSPGYYIIPDYTDAKTLISYAGGPLETAKLQDMRIYRIEKDSSNSILTFNYEDVVWEKELKTFKAAPAIKADDVLVIPTEQRFFLKDYMQYGFSIVSILLSAVSIFIILRR